MPQMPNITVQLVHIQGPLKGQIQDFTAFPVQIGRHSSCQVRFDKDLTTISRRHARIERQGNRFRIIDASTNGTYVNGKRIADVYLRDGDVITFSENGPKASFLTKIESGSLAEPSAPTQQAMAPAVPSQPAIPSPPPVSPARPEAPRQTDAGLTVGPDRQVPVMSATAPLVIQFGPTLRSYNQLPVTVGSDPGCDFVIPDNAVEPRHVQIFFSQEDYYAKDLTGKNMVTINGRPVGSQAVIAQGAELLLSERGPKFRFLGGGRLAEVQVQDTPSEASLAETDVAPNQPDTDDVPAVPTKKSLFKSFFK